MYGISWLIYRFTKLTNLMLPKNINESITPLLNTNLSQIQTVDFRPKMEEFAHFVTQTTCDTNRSTPSKSGLKI